MKKHVALTNEDGDIIGVIGYENQKELEIKTRERIVAHISAANNGAKDETDVMFRNDIAAETTIEVEVDGDEQDKALYEFYLTKVDIF